MVSFTTMPGHGSEGGVGWSFFEAAAQIARRNQWSVDLVYDQRDRADVDEAIIERAWGDAVSTYPVALPRCVARRVGQSRTRMGYLAWRTEASKVARELYRRKRFDVVHQTTFATASLPPVGVGIPTRKIWGPIAIPSQPVFSEIGRASSIEKTSVKLARIGGSRFVRTQDLCVVQNDHTYEFVKEFVPDVIVEPNIVVEPMSPTGRDADKLVFSGNLILRKRPWICLKMMTLPAMRDFCLEVVGDGPLLGSMQSYVRQERLQHRVRFLGRLPRAEALRVVSRAGALLLPSSREGAPWVVGEASALGVPSVVSELSGAQTVVRLSGDMGVVVPEGQSDDETVRNFGHAALSAAAMGAWGPTARWSASRLGPFLEGVWQAS